MDNEKKQAKPNSNVDGVVGAHAVSAKEDDKVEGKLRPKASGTSTTTAVGAHAVSGIDERIEGKLRPKDSTSSTVGAHAVSGPDEKVEGKLRPKDTTGTAVGAQAVSGPDSKVEGKLRARENANVGAQAVSGPDDKVEGKLRPKDSSSSGAGATVGAQAVSGPDEKIEGKLRPKPAVEAVSGPDTKVEGKLRPVGNSKVGAQAASGPDEKVAGKLRPKPAAEAVAGTDAKVEGKLRPVGAQAVAGEDDKVAGKLRPVGGANVGAQAGNQDDNKVQGKLRAVNNSAGAVSVPQPAARHGADKGKRGLRGSVTTEAPGAVRSNQDDVAIDKSGLLLSSTQALGNVATVDYSDELDVDMIMDAMEKDKANAYDGTTTETVPYPHSALPSSSRPANHVVQSGELAVAKPVEEESEHLNLQEADKFDPEAQQKRIQEAKKKNTYIAICGVIVVIILIVVVVFALKNQDEEVVYASAAPSQSPSMAPTSLVEGLMALLPESTQIKIDSDPESPQAKAFQWLVGDTRAFPDWRLVQRYALATFFYALGGEDWYDPTNWLKYGTHECDWLNANYTERFFVYTDPTTGEEVARLFAPGPSICDSITFPNLTGEDAEVVRNIWQYDNGLKGVIPEEIGLLTAIEAFAVNENPDVIGPIPSEVGAFTGLVGLAMQFANFAGTTIPTELFSCEKLRVLALQGSSLGGSLPTEIGNLKDLEFINLRENYYMTGTVPSEIGLLTNIEELDFFRSSNMAEENGLGGQLPSEMGLLTLMTILDFGRSHFSGTLPTELGQLTKMGYFRGTTQSLTGTIPSEFGLMTNMFWLTLEQNQLTGTLPTELGNLPNMIFFNLLDNMLTGTIPSELSGFGQENDLWSIYLNNNQLTGTIPSELGLFRYAEEFWFHNNSLTGTIPTEIGQLMSRGLFDFQVQDNLGIVGTIPSDLCGLNNETCTTFWGAPCTLGFECSETLCGCDCSCSNFTESA